MIKPEKRDEIIRAAMELIAGHGFHGAPMALVAERAGVAAGTIYRYFESKDDLIRATHALPGAAAPGGADARIIPPGSRSGSAFCTSAGK